MQLIKDFLAKEAEDAALQEVCPAGKAAVGLAFLGGERLGLDPLLVLAPPEADEPLVPSLNVWVSPQGSQNTWCPVTSGQSCLSLVSVSGNSPQ